MTTKDLILRKANLSDAEAIDSLMQEVFEHLENKDFFVCDDLSYIREQLRKDGIVVVAEDLNCKCVGSFLLHFPGLSDENLGYDIHLPEKELQCVVHMESAVVHPNYRGLGIQGKMLDFAEEMLKSLNTLQQHNNCNYHYLMATVAPDNTASLHTFLKRGYEIQVTKEKYGGLIRHVLLKDSIQIL